MLKYVLALTCIATSPLLARTGDNIYLGAAAKDQLVVNNRILATVNGKPISVIDVMKQMDMRFYRQYPEFTDSIEARHQFYKANWRHSLDDLIDKELILADAEENKIPITNGDVRQEMEMMFGPNIIANLDKINLTYEEAAEMIKGDIMLRRMLYFRVNSKAMRKVTPQAIRKAYEEIAKDNLKPAEWHYQVISVRHPDATVGQAAADEAHKLLAENIELGQLSTALAQVGVNHGTKINISEEFVQTEQQVNPDHLAVLQHLSLGSFSTPIKQLSRSDNSTVFRILYLKDKKDGGVIPFNEVEKTIRDQLLNQAMDEESIAYLTKLRKYHGISENALSELLEDGFEPFVLK